MEKLLFNRAIEQDKPAFGICRGLQLFNALLGGTLYQDLPTQRVSSIQIKHKQTPPYTIPVHDVHIEQGNPLYEIVKTEFLKVNSYSPGDQKIVRAAYGRRCSGGRADRSRRHAGKEICPVCAVASGIQL